MTLDKLRREAARFPLVALSVVVGSWLAVLLWPQGMNYGEPLADRLAHAVSLSSYPPEIILVASILAASLLFADWTTPYEANVVVRCVDGLFAGALYYELFIGGLLDSLFSGWPQPIGDLLGLSALIWPHIALVAAKLSVAGTRVSARTLPPTQ